MPDNYLAYLPARAAELPSGESSRLETVTVTGGSRYAVTFAADEYAVWTVPKLPAMYQGGTLSLKIECGCVTATSGTVSFDVSVEAVTPGDSLDLGVANSFASTNSLSGSAPGTAGHLFEVAGSLTNGDSAAAGDMLRIKVARPALGGATGTYRIYGMALVESVAAFDLSGYSTISVTALRPGTTSTSAVFKGQPGQTAALTEWRDGANALVGSVAAGGGVSFKTYSAGVAGPFTMTGDVNNYGPSTAGVWLLAPQETLIIAGIVAGTSGERLTLINVGFGSIYFYAESSTSTAANRIAPVTNEDYIVPYNHITLVYDGISQRWRVQKQLIQPRIQIDTFAPGSWDWTPPYWAVTNRFQVMGGGGGGGSGRMGASDTVRSGGAGGAGGQYAEMTTPAEPVEGGHFVSVGNGGTGGPTVFANNTNGNPGNDGESTYVIGNTWIVVAAGGAGGPGGTNAGATGASSAGTFTMFTLPGGTGASSSSIGSTGSDAAASTTTGGGGGGGGLGVQNSTRGGGAGGNVSPPWTTSTASGGAATGNVAGANGNPGGSLTNAIGLMPFGAGGSGGCSGSEVLGVPQSTGGNGGNGGACGGGGGGGGPACNFAFSGAGGTGGGGRCIITSLG